MDETAVDSPVHRQDDDPLPVQVPPAQDTYLSHDVTVPDNLHAPTNTPPVHGPIQSESLVGLYPHPHGQESPEIEDIIIRTRRQVALAVEAELEADRATEAARAAVEEARRLLVEMERQLGAE